MPANTPSAPTVAPKFVSHLRFLFAIGVLTFPALARGQSAASDTVVVQWDAAALQGVRDSRIGPPMVARALAIVHTCIFDAWAAYDKKAIGTQLKDELRRPRSERTLANKNEAISFAAYRALVDLFPLDRISVFDPLMVNLGYDPSNLTINTNTPAGIGNVACAAVLLFRHSDGSNQLGDLHPVAYSDWTGYMPVNPPSTVPINPALVLDPDHWQPLIYDDGCDAVPTFHHPSLCRSAVVPRGSLWDDLPRSISAIRGPVRTSFVRLREVPAAIEGSNHSERELDRQAENDCRVLGKRSAHGATTRTLGTIWPVRPASRQPHGRSGCQNVLCAG